MTEIFINKSDVKPLQYIQPVKKKDLKEVLIAKGVITEDDFKL